MIIIDISFGGRRKSFRAVCMLRLTTAGGHKIQSIDCPMTVLSMQFFYCNLNMCISSRSACRISADMPFTQSTNVLNRIMRNKCVL